MISKTCIIPKTHFVLFYPYVDVDESFYNIKGDKMINTNNHIAALPSRPYLHLLSRYAYPKQGVSMCFSLYYPPIPRIIHHINSTTLSSWDKMKSCVHEIWNEERIATILPETWVAYYYETNPITKTWMGYMAILQRYGGIIIVGDATLLEPLPDSFFHASILGCFHDITATTLSHRIFGLSLPNKPFLQHMENILFHSQTPLQEIEKAFKEFPNTILYPSYFHSFNPFLPNSYNTFIALK